MRHGDRRVLNEMLSCVFRLFPVSHHVTIFADDPTDR